MAAPALMIVTSLREPRSKGFLLQVCDMTHLYVWHDPFVCVIGRIHMCDMTHCDMHDSYVWLDSMTYVRWHIHQSDTNDPCKRGPKPETVCMCVTSLMNEWYGWVTICVWRYSFVHEWVTVCVWCHSWMSDMNEWLYVCDATHSYVWHDAFMRIAANQPCHKYACVISRA